MVYNTGLYRLQMETGYFIFVSVLYMYLFLSNRMIGRHAGEWLKSGGSGLTEIYIPVLIIGRSFRGSTEPCLFSHLLDNKI